MTVEREIVPKVYPYPGLLCTHHAWTNKLLLQQFCKNNKSSDPFSILSF